MDQKSEPPMTAAELQRLIQWLNAASVTTFDFTYVGRQEVCKPRYMLTRDRNEIVRLLNAELARLTQIQQSQRE